MKIDDQKGKGKKKETTFVTTSRAGQRQNKIPLPPLPKTKVVSVTTADLGGGIHTNLNH